MEPASAQEQEDIQAPEAVAAARWVARMPGMVEAQVAETSEPEFAAQGTWEAPVFPLRRSAMRIWTVDAAGFLQRSARPSWLVAEAVDPNPSAFPRCIPPALCRSHRWRDGAALSAIASALAAVESSRDVRPAQEITPFVAMRNKRGHDAIYQSRLPA